MIFNKKKAFSTQGGLLHQLFEKQVEEHPDHCALVSNGWKLTFQQLEDRANRLAHYLQRQGVGPDALVGLSLDRAAPEAIISVLAILKAGGACLPLDPEYPPKRLRFMLEDSRAALLLTDERHEDLFAGQPVRRIGMAVAVSAAEQESDVPPECLATDENLAYVIYTSGSTGQPKGVAMHHRPLVNLIRWQNGQSTLPPQSRTLQFTPLSFDVSFQEIFATLCSGGTLVLISDDERLDPLRLVEFINRHRIERLFLPFAALQYIAETADSQNLLPSPLREVITAGEQLQVNRYIRNLFKRLPDCTLANHYGPTEAHVVTQFMLEGDPAGWPDLPAIGTPIENTQIHILDEQLKPVPDGEKGEIYIAGIAVARGYLHQPERTAEKFVPDPFSAEPEARMYRTGDLGQRLPGGNIEFIGRADNQVKIRGYRIELGEIETVLGGMPSVKQAVAVPWEQQPGSWSLAAYILPRSGEVPTIGKLRGWLAERLPDYMVPSSFTMMDEFPMTPSGKVDRRALPKPGAERPQLDTEYAAPVSEWEKKIVLLWREILSLDAVGIHDSFFELGGTSLLLLRFISRLRQEHGVEVPVAQMFRQGTVANLAAFLEAGTEVDNAAKKIHERAARGVRAEKAVAIVGMAGRFPGADDVDTFWQNLCDGVDSVTFFNDDELDASVDVVLRANPDYVKARGIIADADKFDAAFFGFTPREAEVMDPQQRVMLETGWHALENAGYDSSSYVGIIGVFAGMGNSTYYHENVLTRPDRMAAIGAFQTMVGNEKDYIATSLAYKLNLTGPGVSVHTACSTSLTAVCQAFQSLESGQCDMALAGGVSITTPQNSGYLYQEGGMLSPDGRCRPFDADAQGTTFNNGAAMVVLKRLEDAQADGDRIYAVIRGVGLNNDGAEKMSFSAPSVNGQAGAIAMAHADAGVAPDTISYVEAHGTATPVGDPIEVAALTQAFRVGTDRTQFCALGSLKSNVGHLIAAAGVSGLIKTALSLYHRKIPGTLNFEKPNPQLDLENTPFYVNAKLVEWQPGESPRRAGVSSFGVGGTNAHVILEEAPDVPKVGTSVRPRQLLLLSAKTETALDSATANLSGYFQAHSEADCADAAFTLQTGRRGFSHRRCAVCASAEDAAAVLEKRPPARLASRQWSGSRPPLVFMFPGQGAQYVSMGKNLYDTEPLFRQTVEECAGILAPLMDRGLLDLLYPPADKLEEAQELLKETHYTQPAIFAIEYAMARLLRSWGFEPDAMVGHSIGEFAAACVAGVMTLEDALRLVATRGQMMQELPGGSMLSVRAPLEDIQQRLPENVTPAALNAPGLCVLSGPTDAVEAVAEQLKANGITCKPLRTSHAFHSAMMDPMIEPFAEVVGNVKLSAPKIPFVSTVTADW
ncbi:MAG: amino acid adenylation domain-containing protein, partial [Kiritimatiellales bacterium]|nr:amino acid adenylation domain-containing protein [Kiritimatiellales bacterium]